mmetsp:Transcript_14608/g.42736  ORF Transcript_14608/g.42736 Transcript_14608/m.42736 type:complete len:290 (+) Transcript_14608:1527-2396(+)
MATRAGRFYRSLLTLAVGAFPAPTCSWVGPLLQPCSSRVCRACMPSSDRQATCHLSCRVCPLRARPRLWGASQSSLAALLRRSRWRWAWAWVPHPVPTTRQGSRHLARLRLARSMPSCQAPLGGRQMERAATSGKTDAAATAAVAQGRSQTRSSSATPTPHGGQYRCRAPRAAMSASTPHAPMSAPRRCVRSRCAAWMRTACCQATSRTSPARATWQLRRTPAWRSLSSSATGLPCAMAFRRSPASAGCHAPRALGGGGEVWTCHRCSSCKTMRRAACCAALAAARPRS